MLLMTGRPPGSYSRARSSQGDVQLDLKEFIEEMGAALTNYAVPGSGAQHQRLLLGRG